MRLSRPPLLVAGVNLVRTAACALLLTIGAPASAQPLTGNTLYSWLIAPDKEMQAMMYVRGFIEAQFDFPVTLRAAIDGKEFAIPMVCAPDKSTVRQAGDIVRSALAKAPASRHEPAHELIRAALFEAGWRCVPQ